MTTRNITDAEQRGDTGSGLSPGLTVTIDTVMSATPACATDPNPAADGTDVTTTCSEVEALAMVSIPDMVCEPTPAGSDGVVACDGIVGFGSGQIAVDNGIVSVTDQAGNSNTSATTGLVIRVIPVPTLDRYGMVLLLLMILLIAVRRVGQQ